MKRPTIKKDRISKNPSYVTLFDYKKKKKKTLPTVSGIYKELRVEDRRPKSSHTPVTGEDQILFKQIETLNHDISF